MTQYIFKHMLLNMSLLVLIAYLLTKIKLIKNFILYNESQITSQIFLATLFGGIGILSTYLGVQVDGGVVNNRAISIVISGLIGGPIAGIGAGFIAGLHRYLIDINGFTALACGISTLAGGIIGGIFSKKIKQSNCKWIYVLLITTATEVLQMLVILLVAKPFERAFSLVTIIFLPMAIFNALGAAIFISIFDSVFIEKDYESATRFKLSLDIADQCLPYFREGFCNKEGLMKVCEIIVKHTKLKGILMTDTLNKIGYYGDDFVSNSQYIPLFSSIIQNVLLHQKIQVVPIKDLHCTIIAAPLRYDSTIIGTLVAVTQKYKMGYQSDMDLVVGLAKLFSTQIHLSELEYQNQLLQKAEFMALQSQINPHFLFNALNTISAFCRERPQKARELLIDLSHYFRYTLKETTYMVHFYKEIEHINSYLKIEKARFEDRLTIELDIPPHIECQLPSLILQPIVENAIKHGAMNQSKKGLVKISAEDYKSLVKIKVYDNGIGMPADMITALLEDKMPSHKIGLQNVHKRLKSIYGHSYGLKFLVNDEGTCCEICIPKKGGSRCV